MAEDRNEATQGAAVKKALKGDRSRDIDRWDGFSKAEAQKLANDPAPPAAVVEAAGGAGAGWWPGGGGRRPLDRLQRAGDGVDDRGDADAGLDLVGADIVPASTFSWRIDAGAAAVDGRDGKADRVRNPPFRCPASR